MADEPTDWTERLLTLGEMAELVEVGEDDLRTWITSGALGSEPGADGEPRVRVSESRRADGPLSQWEVAYRLGVGTPALQAAQRRHRERRRRAGASDEIAVEVLTAAFARRLADVAPSDVEIAVPEWGQLLIVDRVSGGAAGIGLAPAEAVYDVGSSAQQVRAVLQQALEIAQDEFAEVSTEPWPRRGGGALPTPRALLGDGRIRLLYGDPADPILELEPLPVADVVR